MKRELTLADIAGYLPHKLQIESQFDGKICTANIWNLQGAIVANFKPILRPMSDLCEEITEQGYNEGKPFVPIVTMAKVAYKGVGDWGASQIFRRSLSVFL